MNETKSLDRVAVSCDLFYDVNKLHYFARLNTIYLDFLACIQRSEEITLSGLVCHIQKRSLLDLIRLLAKILGTSNRLV
jgi:hypothetical protein